MELPYTIKKIREYWNKPSCRSTLDSNIFQKVEKFDTWLNLDDLLNTRNLIKDFTRWNSKSLKEFNDVLSKETCLQLSLCGYKPRDLLDYTLTPTLPAKVIHQALTGTIQRCHLDTATLQNIHSTSKKAASVAIDVQIDHFVSSCSPDLKKHFEPVSAKCKDKINCTHPRVLAASLVAEDLLKVHLMHKELSRFVQNKSLSKRVKAKLELNKFIFTLPSLGMKVQLFSDIILCLWGSQRYILTVDLFLEMMNKAQELESTLLYSHMQSGTILPEGHIDFIITYMAHLARTVQSFECNVTSREILERANTGFAYLKCIEGLGVAYMIYKSDQENGWENPQLMNALWASMLEINITSFDDFQESFLYKLWDRVQIPQIGECLGLIKLCGHPGIEVKKGMEDLYARTHENITVNPEAVKRTICVLKRDLIKNFHIVHGRYPLLDLNQMRNDSQLKRLISRRIGPTEPEALTILQSIALEEWGDIVLLKNAEFDMVENQLSILKDKSVGLTRSKVFQTVVSGYGNIKTGAREERRALLRFLLTPNFTQEYLDYMSNFMIDDPWTDAVLEYMVIKLTMKELEEKAAGRPFGASPTVERNRRIVFQYNMMKQMDAYDPEQLITPDELSIIQKLFSFRTFKTLFKDHVILQISFDFSKWNNRMRAQFTDVIGAAVHDPWFGVTGYRHTMSSFEHTIFLFILHFLMVLYHGQPGGIEGLAQPQWTKDFGGGVKGSIETLAMPYQMTVKGDDLRIAVAVAQAIVRELGLDAVRDMIMNQMQQLCADLGWQLNPQESFVSISLIATSKQYQINETWLAASAKKMMKAQAMTNVIIPTTDDLVSSIFSTCHSAASQSTAILPCYATATLLAAKLLIQTMYDDKLNQFELTALLLWPQVLGGPGSLPLEVYFIRGENDMLSIIIALFKFIFVHHADNPIAAYLKRICQIEIDSNPDMGLLLGDPYSIPIKCPPRPYSVLKRQLLNHLKTFVLNNDIKHLLTDSSRESEIKFKNLLTSMRPYSAKIATLCWESSPFYIKRELVAKFLQSSTIFSFLSQSSIPGKNPSQRKAKAHMVFKKILHSAQERQRFWTNIIRRLSVFPTVKLLGIDESIWMDPHYCPTKLTQNVRDTAWGIQIHHITYPSLVTQNRKYTQDDILKMIHHYPIKDMQYFTYINQRAIKPQLPYDSHHYASVAGVHPWLGARTSPNINMPNLQTRIKSPTLSKILKLMGILRCGATLGPDYERLIKLCLSGLTNENLDDLDVMIGESPGGSIPHRQAIASYSLCTMPNCRPNLLQLVKVETESSLNIKADATNRTINYAACYYYSVFIATFYLQMHEKLPDNYPNVISTLLHFDDTTHENKYILCPYCASDVSDVPITLNWDDPPDLSEYANNPVIGCSPSEVTVLRKNMVEAVEGKVRTLAKHRFRDPNDPLNLELAAAILMHHGYAQDSKIYNLLSAYMVTDMPTGDDLESTLNMRGLKEANISLSAIKLIPNDILYLQILFNSYTWIVREVDIHDTFLALDQLELSRRTMTPISLIFDKVIMAGKINSIVRGAEQVGLVRDKIVFNTSSANSGFKASKIFIQHHLHLFKAWVENGEQDSRMMFYCNQESLEKILEDLNNQRKFLKKSLVRYLIYNQHESAYTTSKRVMRQLVESSTNLVDRLRSLKANHPELKTKLSTCLSQARLNDHTYMMLNNIRAIFNGFQLELRTVLRNLMFEWIQTDQTDQINLILKLWVLFSTDYLVVDDYTELDDQTIRNMTSSIQLCIFKDDWNGERGLINFTLIDQDPILSHFCQSLTLELYLLWEQIFSTIEWYIDHPTFHNLANNLVVKLKHITTTNGNVKIGAMTFLDAQNFIKAQSKPVPSVDQLAPILEERDRDEVDALLHTYYPIQCNDRDCMIAPPVVYALGTFEQSFVRQTASLTIFNPAVMRQSMFLYRLDPVNQYRTLGSVNKSVIKLFSIISLEDWWDTRMNQNVMANKCIVALADGTGSNAKLFYDLYQTSSIVFCSLSVDPLTLETKADGTISNPPAAFLGDDVMTHASRLLWRNMFPGDLTLKETISQVMTQIKATGQEVGLVFCDIDKDFHQDPQVYWRALFNTLIIAIRTKDIELTYIIKVKPDNTSYCYLFFSWINNIFSHVHIRRTFVSRNHDHEIYVTCQQLRLTCYDLQDIDLMEPPATNWPLFNLYILERLQSYQIVVRSIKTFYETGLVLEDDDIEKLLQDIEKYKIPIPPFKTFFQILPELTPRSQLHFCQVAHKLRARLFQHVASSRAHFQNDLSQVRTSFTEFQVYKLNRQILITGLIGVTTSLIRIFTMEAMLLWLNEIGFYPQEVQIPRLKRGIQEYVNNMMLFTRRLPELFRWEVDKNCILLRLSHKVINLNSILYQTSKCFLAMRGYMNMVTYLITDVSHSRLEVLANQSGFAFQECCTDIHDDIDVGDKYYIEGLSSVIIAFDPEFHLLECRSIDMNDDNFGSTSTITSGLSSDGIDDDSNDTFINIELERADLVTFWEGAIQGMSWADEDELENAAVDDW